MIIVIIYQIASQLDKIVSEYPSTNIYICGNYVNGGYIIQQNEHGIMSSLYIN